MPANDDTLQALASGILELGNHLILVVTGAGISQASGIDTFRGNEPDAVWKVSDMELATAEYFWSDPVGHWSWYLERFRKVDTATPNPAHDALRILEQWQLERGGRFQLVTQNIDTLHEQAGSGQLIKIHGTSDRLRCSQTGCKRAAPKGSVLRSEVDLARFKSQPTTANLPRCPSCGGVLRAHVLFFDEFYQEHTDYRFDEVLRAGDTAELVLFVGTSFSVGITDIIARGAMAKRVPVFSIDPSPSANARPYRITQIDARAEIALPKLVQDLKEASDDSGYAG